MAVVRGIKEKVHLPLYDAIIFKKDEDISTAIANAGNLIKFFVNVQDKTKLETNQQEASVLSHYNTFEARSMRVIVEPPTTTEGTGQNQSKRPDSEFLSNFIYNSVTSFIVGEKIMISAPTWFFPAGAGPSNLGGITNGEPSPEATFRFAEPVNISHQQNFRAEIEFPRGAVDAFSNGTTSKGPAKIWVVVDGYMSRDVQ